ncbi:hypothetical protein [Nocardia sp. NPDC052566]|uniref:hypothetical protein n=1 Tax=Nocardia sp. NPDC052566 TaxID=3364330 RepID=UPI0037C78C39
MRAIVGPHERAIVVGSCPARPEDGKRVAGLIERRVIVGGAMPTRRGIGPAGRRRRTR